MVKNSHANSGDLIPGSGRSPGVGDGNPLLYPCLENPMERGGWWVAVHRVANSHDRTRTHSTVKEICQGKISKSQPVLSEIQRQENLLG